MGASVESGGYQDTLVLFMQANRLDIPVASVSPIKVDAATDRMIADAAHFLGRTKKDIVDVAVRDYVDAHRAEINESIRGSLARLDGTRASIVGEITGLSRGELDDLGGVPED